MHNAFRGPAGSFEDRQEVGIPWMQEVFAMA